MSDSIMLHHINLPTSNVEVLAEFYRNILCLKDFSLERVPGYRPYGTSKSVLLEADLGQLHLGVRRPDLLFDNAHAVNPQLDGHIAFRVDDVGRIIENLKRHGVPYAEYGLWAISGWYQVFFHDPEGNVVEVHDLR